MILKKSIIYLHFFSYYTVIITFIIYIKENLGIFYREFRKTRNFRQQSLKSATWASFAFRRSLLYSVRIATLSGDGNGISRENFRSTVEMDVIPSTELVDTKQTSATVMNSCERDARIRAMMMTMMMTMTMTMTMTTTTKTNERNANDNGGEY